jgi:hypothetical protein
MPTRTCLLFLCSFTTILIAADSDLAKRRKDIQTRWASFENITAAKGKGGSENRGAKGHAFDSIAPGETKVLLDTQGAGEIRRMWFTVSSRDPQMLRAGGDRKDRVSALAATGAPIRPVSVDDKGRFSKLLDSSPPRSLAQDPLPADAWANYQRRDDWSAIALYYMDSPENGLGPLAPAAERTAGLSETESR